MSNDTPNMLFYSRNCKTCNDLFTVLKNENMLSYLKLVCVDNILDKIPSNITVVPTLMLTNINKPLVCKEIFEWINAVKSFNSGSSASSTGTNKSISHGKLADVSGYTHDNLTHVTKDKDNNPYYDINGKVEPIVTPKLDTDTIKEKELENMILETNDERTKQTSFFSNIFSSQHEKILSNNSKTSIKSNSYDNEFKKIRR